MDASQSADNGLFAIRQPLPSNYYTLHVSGIVMLKAGQRLVTYVSSQNPANYTIQGESAFSVVAISASEGMGAEQLGQYSTHGVGWTTVRNFGVSQAGGFRLGEGFDTSSGQYTVQKSGYFIVDAQVVSICVFWFTERLGLIFITNQLSFSSTFTLSTRPCF